METPQRNFYTDYLVMPLHTENLWTWNPSSIEAFQEIKKNENQQSWSPWAVSWNPLSVETFQGNKKSKNKENSHSYATFKSFSSAAGNLGDMQSKSGGFVSDDLMIFQNILNETRLTDLQNFRASRDFTSRNKKRKNRKRNRPKEKITNDVTMNSFHGLQEQRYQRWNHVPVFDWSQSNLSPKSIKTNFQNSLTFGSFNERDKNTQRHQHSTRKKFTQNSTNVSGSTSEIASSTNFKSRNLSNICAGTLNIGNSVSDFKPALNLRNRSIRIKMKINERNKMQPNPLSSENFGNNEDDDIIYLFSVDSSSEDKILEIDLVSNQVHLVPNRNSKEAVNLTGKTKTDGAKKDLPIIIIEEESETSVPVTSRKRKLDGDDDKANKRSNYVPRCSACDMHYDDAIEKSGNMYISSSCNHVFCNFCISKDGKLEVCPTCNMKFLSFRRLYI